ncbi:MAG: P27 family phage terminase small subunit [Clostridia bacterium]|nr:P27 family phage terminase small subunit [Clostridia bacterium]
MAKDGTNRGGQRVGSGRKSKALTDKIAVGKADGAMILPKPADIEGAEMPPVKEYLKAAQKNGKDLCAEEVYKETFLWLKARGCEALVNNQLIEQYAMSVSRWIQCEDAISEFGFLAKHPTTGNAIASPYVAMSQTYMKQVNQTWYQIYQVVKENCSVEYGGKSPQDDLMERLLSARKGNQ